MPSGKSVMSRHKSPVTGLREKEFQNLGGKGFKSFRGLGV